VIILLIPTTASLGTTTAQTNTHNEDDFIISITGGLKVTAIIMNNGTNNTSNVVVTLHVRGGVLKRINTTITDTVTIPSRGVAIISTTTLLGLGPITIIVSANATKKTAQGMQIIMFSKVMDDTWTMLAERNTNRASL